MIDWQSTLADYGKIGAAIGALIYAAIRGHGWLKRKSAEDGAAIAVDHAHVDMLKRCQEDAEQARTRADQAYAERNMAMTELGALRTRVELLQKRCDDCDKRTADLELQILYLRGIVDRRLKPRE